ncbi:MAG: hypothetical protein LBV32_11165 [Tannerellaceae bacterium]|jgi:hypothetical protein|nr:hypothetical protein [Tannerellaceae bacterium]
MNRIGLKFPAKNVWVASALMCGSFLMSCGGSGGGGSKLGKNDYLGNLPAVYDGYNMEVAALEEKTNNEGEKLMSGGEKNYDKIQAVYDEQKVKEKELKEQFNTDVKAELSNIVGKEVPVTFSEGLKNSGKFYYDATVKIGELRDEPRLSVTLSAKDDFTVPSMQSYDYTVYLRLVGKDGVVLENSTTVIMPIPLAREAKSFGKGDVLIADYAALDFNLSRYAADRVNFAGVEFISTEEYNAINQ